MDYELTNKESAPIALRLGSEFNLAAGFSPESVGLVGLRGHEEVVLETVHKSAGESLLGFRLSNLVKGEKIEARAELPFALSHSPLFSEGKGEAFPAAYQGCGILLGWDMDIPPDSSRRLSVTLELRS